MKSRAFLMVVLALVAASAFAADSGQLSVTVKEAQVRATASALGKLVGVLAYGDKVTVLDQPAGAPAGWLMVKSADGKLQGWVKSAALTKKEIAMSAGSKTASQTASSGDVALAGKGFNKDVEAQYKQEQKLDYTWVDRMETFTVLPEQVAAFLTAGGLTEQGGAK
jgi:hypothetical protein